MMKPNLSDYDRGQVEACRKVREWALRESASYNVPRISNDVTMGRIATLNGLNAVLDSITKDLGKPE